LIITGVITAVSLKPLKPKALPRRARGNRTCPVPSCSIWRNEPSHKARWFLLNWVWRYFV